MKPGLFVALALFVCIAGSSLHAQTGAPVEDELSSRQRRISEQYRALEAQMLKMAQLEAQTNPRRAALLQEAMKLSGEHNTRLQLETIVNMLAKRQLSRAVKEQADAGATLEELLKLLQSENRTERLKSEQQRLKEYIKEVERMLRIQKSLEGQTEGSAEAKRLAEEQAKLAERTGDLAEKIRANEEEAGRPSESGEKPKSSEEDSPKSNGENKPSDMPPGEKKPGDAEKKPDDPNKKPDDAEKKSEGEKKPSDMKPGEQKPGEDAKPQEGSDSKPSDSKPMESKPGEGQESPQQGKPSDKPPQQGEQSPMNGSQQQPPEENPARKRLEQARKDMESAAKKLAEAKKQDSLEDQRKALEELEKAKADLERILKQLREEEVERTLAALEARFRKMLEMQLRVLDGTKKLASIPVAERTRENDLQAGRLGGDEQKIVLEAEKSLELLHEEGSSVAFPATVDLMLEDMRSAAQRLNQSKLDSLTVGLEEDIVAALEELIAALDQAQKENEEKKKEEEQQQEQQQQGEQENALVDAIAELKLIKSLQLRVNTRTNRYARLLDDENDPVGQAEAKELLTALDQLGERQRQVYEIVRKLVLGLNQ